MRVGPRGARQRARTRVSGSYIDTSALLKWYLPETGSEKVVAYLQQCGPASNSLLTKMPVRSALARYVRTARDALHLGATIAGRAEEMATADRLMARASERAGLTCRLFAG